MPLIISPRLAERLREETGFDVTGHPDFVVHDPYAPVITIRPSTVERMRLAELCQRTASAVRNGELRHGD